MVGLRDLTAPLAVGLPNITPLILRKRILVPGDTYPTTAHIVIEPQPYVSIATPKLASAYQALGITIEVDDIEVRGVSQRHPRTDLVGTGISYWLDATLSSDGKSLIGGYECDFVGIVDNTLTWDMVLRRKPDDR